MRTLFSIAILVLLVIGALCPSAEAADDYVAYWSFDEGAGTVLADSGSGGLTGEVFGAAWAPGIRGTALKLSRDDYVEITDADGCPDSIAGLAQGSISVWFQVHSVPGVNEIHPLVYLGSGVGGSANSGVIIEVGHFMTDTRLYFTVYDGPGPIPQCYDSVFDLQLDRWYHFVAVVGDGFNTGYLDGMELIDRRYNFGAATDDYFFQDVANPVGCWLGLGFLGIVPTMQTCHGTIDELRIYDYPLAATEIAAYYESIMLADIPFVRGDVNEDGHYDLADAIGTLDILFGGAESSCDAAVDTNANDMLDIGDAIFTLTSVFLGGPAPSTPHPDCGFSESPLVLSCERFTHCL